MTKKLFSNLRKCLYDTVTGMEIESSSILESVESFFTFNQKEEQSIWKIKHKFFNNNFIINVFKLNLNGKYEKITPNKIYFNEESDNEIIIDFGNNVLKGKVNIIFINNDISLTEITATPTPTPTVTITPTLTVTPTYTPTPTVTISPTITPTVTITPTNTASVTPTVTVTPSVEPTPTPTVTPEPTMTPTISPTVTPTPSVSPFPPIVIIGQYASGGVGEEYFSELIIQGGNGGYTNPQVVSGALPDGLYVSVALNRLRVSGTPSAIQWNNFILSVQSANGQIGFTSQSILITGTFNGEIIIPSDPNE